MNYPEHHHPHGGATEPNQYRIWVCEECTCTFTDAEDRPERDSKDWGHPCKSRGCRKGQRCESHLESYLPELVKTAARKYRR